MIKAVQAKYIVSKFKKIIYTINILRFLSIFALANVFYQ